MNAVFYTQVFPGVARPSQLPRRPGAHRRAPNFTEPADRFQRHHDADAAWAMSWPPTKKNSWRNSARHHKTIKCL